MDGVVLSDTGNSHMKSLSLDFPRKKRKKALKIQGISDMEAGILAAIESVVSGGGNLKYSNALAIIFDQFRSLDYITVCLFDFYSR